MRIRKGHHCLRDRSFSHEGFAHRENHARAVEEVKGEVNQTSPWIVTDQPVAAPCTNSANSECANGLLVRADVDLGRKRLSADGNSRRRPQISEAEVLSISSIIQAGKGSARSDSASAGPASADSVVTSETSVATGVTDCSPSVAMESFVDQPTLLLQSLNRVCTAAGKAGLTAKEAVAKIVERGLPGLNEGGERLIVQVAKSFRSSLLFLEERGRYFMQESPSLKDYRVSSDTRNSSNRGEKASSSASEIETAIEAARQLQNLQRVPEGVGNDAGLKTREEKAVADRRVGTSGSKSRAKANSSSGPLCNRDDGKGWRCFRPSESGFSLCKYHRDQIRRAEVRRRRLKSKSKEQSPVKDSNSTTQEAVKAGTSIPEADIEKIVDAKLVESDDGLPDQKRRRCVKAKSLKSIL